MPPLRLTDDELIRRNPRDVWLYEQMLRIFKQRMHALEAAVKARVWTCKF